MHWFDCCDEHFDSYGLHGTRCHAVASCSQTLGSDLPLFVATDNVNRTLLAPLLRAFPKVCALVKI